MTDITAASPPSSKYEHLITTAQATRSIRTVVTHPCDETSLSGALEAGNMLAKNLTFLSHADAAGVLMDARVPIVLTSRADTVRARLASCAVASLFADARRRAAPVAS